MRYFYRFQEEAQWMERQFEMVFEDEGGKRLYPGERLQGARWYITNSDLLKPQYGDVISQWANDKVRYLTVRESSVIDKSAEVLRRGGILFFWPEVELSREDRLEEILRDVFKTDLDWPQDLYARVKAILEELRSADA